MTTRVLLVRHGATAASTEDRFAGSIDVPLSPQGEAQAAALSKRLADSDIAAVYCSPMIRTVRTAEIVAGAARGPVTKMPELREIDHGRWEGKKRSDVEKEFADEYRSWDNDPFTFAPVGGESGLGVVARALPVIRGLVEKHAGHAVLVVSHKATIRLLIGSFLGFDLRSYRDRLDQSPCSLNVLDFKDGGRARLMLFNDVSHYESVPRFTPPSLSKWWTEGEKKKPQ